MKKDNGTSSVTLRLPNDIKSELTAKAEKKGMDTTKLTRAILINALRPGTFEI